MSLESLDVCGRFVVTSCDGGGSVDRVDDVFTCCEAHDHQLGSRLALELFELPIGCIERTCELSSFFSYA